MTKHQIHVIARAVIRAENHVLVARCNGARNTFLPGGHVQHGEAMQDAIARELREELGERSSVGDYIGAVEHSFSENGLNQHEINHLFDVELPDVRGLTPITSLENHLEFFWHPIGSLDSINLAPAPVVAWIEMPKSEIRWASTLPRNAGEPNKPYKVAMVLGLASAKVSLARAHDAWAAAYERERARIVAAVGEHLLDIQHVGSTSIPNVPAKPILDILVGVRDFDEATACVGPMIAIGYTYRGENGIPRRHYFVKGDPRTHHVHIVEVRSDGWRVTLRFRDLLRMNPVLASEYAREKERLVLLHHGNREVYQREKDKIVESILARETVE